MVDQTTTIIIVVLVVVMIAVVWLELRYLRRKSKSRRQRAAQRPEELQDEAHNALITTRAIASTLAERGGIRSDEVDSLLREAQMAYSRRNYRVSIDLTAKAKDRLAALRKEHAAQGDLAKVAAPPPAASEDEEPTTKEVLQNEYAPNLIQSRFAISLAESAITDGQTAGRDVAQAQALVADARARFDAQDYSGALSMARQGERSARGEAVTVSVPPPSTPATAPAAPGRPVASKSAPAAVAVGSACPSCGEPMKVGDAFCRKCGARVVVTNCPTCGADLLADDAFCRKCGTRIQH
ncbi:MAG TPA: zinc ribbon domain-containing protein [Thermoplasmata archaeon]|nr:zinc ribbon domain-containing protein [Thermoplasmata archaeon]